MALYVLKKVWVFKSLWNVLQMYFHTCFYIQVIEAVSPDITAFDSAAVLLDLPSSLEADVFFVKISV